MAPPVRFPPQPCSAAPLTVYNRSLTRMWIHLTLLPPASRASDTAASCCAFCRFLGLVISKQLVEMMGGGIWAETAPGKGSVFRFTARFGHGKAFAAVTQASVEYLAAARARLRGANILLAEDNPFTQQVAAELLEETGATVALANNGREALALLFKERFDIVLMDVQMPEMDGYEATRKIRAPPRLAGQKVIA